jgi:amino acid transporter
MGSSAAQPPNRRRFTLLDGMILVAAPAVGLGVLRGAGPLSDWMELPGAILANWAWDRNLIDQLVGELLLFVMPSAVTTSLAVLAIRLRRPRPSWRRLARQPGLVAGLALVAAWVVAGLFTVVHLASDNNVFGTPVGGVVTNNPGYWLQVFASVGSALGGFAVAIAWGTLALVRRWRPEAGWVDRLGRLVGVGWIVMAVLGAHQLRSGLL